MDVDVEEQVLAMRRKLGVPDDARVPEIGPCQFDGRLLKADETIADLEVEMAAQFARTFFDAHGVVADAAALEYVIRSRHMRERRRIEGW